MAASGDARSLNLRRMLLAAAATTLFAAACASASERARESPRQWCQAQPSAAWKRLLAKSVVPLSRRVQLVPWSLAHDGRSLFASIYDRDGWSGVARVDVPTGRVARIRDFAHPHTDQADGAFDGRWLVWNEYHS